MNRKLILAIVAVMISSSSLFAQHDRFFFRLLEGRGQLSRTNGSTWLALQEIQPVDLVPGDMLKVEGSGRGLIFYPDGTTIRIKNNAVITVLRDAIQLRIGYAWLQVRKRADMFKVFTPLGSCHVLGTSFDVDVNRFGRTEVRVFDGIVAVRANDDERNRQLVLQSDMKTVVNDSSRVADQPDRFQASTLMTTLNSDWTSRSLIRTDRTAGISLESGLPPIREEVEGAVSGLPPVTEVIDDFYAETPEEIRIDTIARQRSGFHQMLRERHLNRDAVIGSSIEDSDELKRRMHGYELGQYNRPTSMISDPASLDREYYTKRNRLLRVQSQIRQAEIEIGSMINQNNPSPAHQRRISSLQHQMRDLEVEQRALINRLRDLQTRKR